MKSKDNNIEFLKLMIETIKILRDPDWFRDFLKTVNEDDIKMVKAKRSELESYQMFGLIAYISFLDDTIELLKIKVKELE